MGDYDIDSLKERFKYAPVVARVAEEYKKATKQRADGYIPIIGNKLNLYPEKIVREAYRIYMRDYRGKHPNYFFGIVKQLYKELGDLNYTGEVL